MKKLRKFILPVLVFSMMTTMLSGCGKSGGSNETLNILVWSEYIPETWRA